jgi:hypothetical protein
MSFRWQEDAAADGPDAFAIIGDSECVPISSSLFASHSLKHRQFLASAGGCSDIRFDSSFTADHVKRFIDACQGRPLMLTIDNAFEIECLCDEWQVVENLRAEVTAFIESHCSALSLLEFRLERGLPTVACESRLRSHLPDLIDDPRIFNLPFPILSRVVDFGLFDSDHGSRKKLFDFCLSVMDARGSAASCLFRTLNVDRLTCGDLQLLCSRADFRWVFVSDSIGRRLKNIIDHVTDLEGQIASLSQAFETMQVRLWAELAAQKQRQEAQMSEMRDLQRLHEESQRELRQVQEDEFGRLKSAQQEMGHQLAVAKSQQESGIVELRRVQECEIGRLKEADSRLGVEMERAVKKLQEDQTALKQMQLQHPSIGYPDFSKPLLLIPPMTTPGRTAAQTVPANGWLRSVCADNDTPKLNGQPVYNVLLIPAMKGDRIEVSCCTYSGQTSVTFWPCK